MEMKQQEITFAPIALVLNTVEEAETFWSIMRNVEENTYGSAEYALSVEICNWFSNHAHL